MGASCLGHCPYKEEGLEERQCVLEEVGETEVGIGKQLEKVDSHLPKDREQVIVLVQQLPALPVEGDEPGTCVCRAT